MFALGAAALLGFSSTASAHDHSSCCAKSKKNHSSCCTDKSQKSCCADKGKKSCCTRATKAGASGHCRSRSIFGYNGLGNPVHLRKGCPHSACKAHRNSSGCCKSGKSLKCCKVKKTKSSCPMTKAGCCSN
jgi:hypothetical protein